MFEYILEKIKKADFEEKPFKHIYIEDFFSKEDFAMIVADPQINVPRASSDEEVFNLLEGLGYSIVPFPGCTLDKDRYIKSRKGLANLGHHETTEGEGIALRNVNPSSQIIKAVDEFFRSDDFYRTVAEKFNLDLDGKLVDAGIQKYLDGYEISPHPDTRKKAFTFMININPSAASEENEHHTSYLNFKTERDYVRRFWEGNPSIDRCFVPYSWCNVIYTQNKNNSIVMFAPNNETLHSVKCDYSHLEYQRTQIYGNLWFKEKMFSEIKEYTELDLIDGPKMFKKPSIKSQLRKAFGYRSKNIDLDRKRLY